MRRPSLSRSVSRRVLLRAGAVLPLATWAGPAHSGRAPLPADAQWWQWRGPTGNGVAPSADPPLAWSQEQNIRWKARLPGHGTGCPIVWGDRIFVQTATAARPEDRPVPGAPVRWVLLCLERGSGRTLWERVVREEVPHEGHHPDHGFASQSPVTDGELVLASFGSRGVYCFDLDGNPRWDRDLGRMRTRNGFGEGSSPALHGNVLVINWDHEGEDFVVALDRRTGQGLWRRPRNEPTSWSTPHILQHEGTTQVVIAASRRVISYDLATGRELWECGGLTGNVIPTPVSGHGMVYVMSGFRGNALLAIRLGREGDLTGTDAIAWTHNRATPYVPAPLLYDRRLYFFGANTGILSCFDALSGQPLINAERVEGLVGVYASPVGAAGRIYLVGRNGTTVVARHADKLEVLATNELGEKMDATPAMVGGQIFLRGHQHLYCIAVA